MCERRVNIEWQTRLCSPRLRNMQLQELPQMDGFTQSNSSWWIFLPWIYPICCFNSCKTSGIRNTLCQNCATGITFALVGTYKQLYFVPLVPRDGITLHRPLLMELIMCQFVPRIFDFSLYKFQHVWLFFFNQKLFQTFNYSRHFSSPLSSAPSPFLGISYYVCKEWRTREKGNVTLHNTSTAGFCEVWTDYFWHFLPFWNLPSQTWEEPTLCLVTEILNSL